MDDSEITKKEEREARKREYMQKRLEKKNKGSENGKKVNIDDRIPPGQHYSERWQVLDLGKRPEMDIENNWTLTLKCKGRSKQFTLAELKKLGVEEFTSDFHCVTTWSALDLKWRGISFKKILEAASEVILDTNWQFLIQTGKVLSTFLSTIHKKLKDGYTTNAPRRELEKENVFLAFEQDGKPIPKEHGFIRLLIPQLYGWKSSKFLVELEFKEKDEPGYWERCGYSNVGEVWKNDRYNSSSDP